MARRVRAALLAAFCVALATWVSAQARWAQPYRQGREAVNEGRYKEGDIVLLSGFGAGLAWGTAVMRW